MKKVTKILLLAVVTWLLFAKTYKAGVTCVFDFSIDGLTDSLYFYANDDGELVNEFYVESTNTRYKFGDMTAKIFNDKQLAMGSKDIFEYYFTENKGNCPSSLEYITIGPGSINYAIAPQSSSVFAGPKRGNISYNAEKSSAGIAEITYCSQEGYFDPFNSADGNIASDYSGRSYYVKFFMQNGIKKVISGEAKGSEETHYVELSLNQEVGNYVQDNTAFVGGGKHIRYVTFDECNPDAKITVCSFDDGSEKGILVGVGNEVCDSKINAISETPTVLENKEEYEENYAEKWPETEPDGGNVYISSATGLCVDYLGHASIKGTMANKVDSVFTIVKIAAIVLFVGLSMKDLTGVIATDKSELVPAVKTIGIKALILVLVLLLPTIIDMIFGLFGYTDVLCGIK